MYNKISGLTKRNIMRECGSLSFPPPLSFSPPFCPPTLPFLFSFPFCHFLSFFSLSLPTKMSCENTEKWKPRIQILEADLHYWALGFPVLRTTEKSFCVLSYTNCEILSWKPKMTVTREHDWSLNE